MKSDVLTLLMTKCIIAHMLKTGSCNQKYFPSMSHKRTRRQDQLLQRRYTRRRNQCGSWFMALNDHNNRHLCRMSASRDSWNTSYPLICFSIGNQIKYCALQIAKSMLKKHFVAVIWLAFFKALVQHTNIGSDNGLSPCRRQAIIWTNAGI